MRSRLPVLCWLRLHRWRRAEQTPWLESCQRCGKVRRILWGAPGL